MKDPDMVKAKFSVGGRLPAVSLLMAVLAFSTSPALSSALEQAKRMHDRLAGVPPSQTVLSQMKALIESGNAAQAAELAMQNPAFYNVTLKNWASPWTNRDDDKFAPLNDYTATIIGIVRDGIDYRQVLYGDIIYVPASGTYSPSDNTLYELTEAAYANLGDASVLVQRTQSSVTGLPANATAGVMTTRAAARAFFIDGTNRAMFRFTLKNHLCNDMEQVLDTSRPVDRIRQDVSRSPGGDSRIFNNNCVGCHSGMDPLAQAFAYYQFSYSGDPDTGHLVYTPGSVQPKYHINADNFRPGFVTPDDRWDNYWRDGPNTAIFGWDSSLPGGGHGAKSMGQELAHSDAFAQCSVRKVFQAVCLRDPGPGDQAQFATMLNNFRGSNYNLRRTFADAAAYCMGL
jgi:hypothetical protein